MARLASNLIDTQCASAPEKVDGVLVHQCKDPRTNQNHDADVVRRILARWIAQQIVTSAKEKP